MEIKITSHAKNDRPLPQAQVISTPYVYEILSAAIGQSKPEIERD